MEEFEIELRHLAFERLKFLLLKIVIPINLFFIFSDYAQDAPLFVEFVYVRLFLTIFTLAGFLAANVLKFTKFWLVVPYAVSFAFSIGIGWIALKLGGEKSPYFTSGSSTICLAAATFVVWPRPIHAINVVVGNFLIFFLWLAGQSEPIVKKFLVSHFGNMMTFAAMGYMLNVLVIKLRREEFASRKKLSLEIENREKIISEKVTALESARAEITTKQAQLDTATKLADLASQVAHDIRSPLTALKMTLSDGAPKTDEAFKLSRTALFRINDIANNLLNYRKRISPMHDESPSKGESLQVYLLAATVDQLLSEKRTIANLSKKIDIDFEVNATHLNMFTSIPSNELVRVVSNIVGNAIDASSQGGYIKVTLHERDGQLLLKVKDSGKGISGEVLARVGQKGFTDGKPGGNGLGIYFAKEFLKLYGGSLDISSREGVGTEVVVSIPTAKAPSWSVSELSLATSAEIVVVDDDESIHQLWSQRLSAVGSRIPVRFFFSIEEFEAWYSKSVDANRIYIFDYEFKDRSSNGLMAIEKCSLKNSILVTSRFEDVEVVKQVNRLGVKMIPKSMLQHVRLTFV